MSPRSSVVEQVQARTLAGAIALPPSVRRRLAGSPPRVDGDHLALDVHTALWLMRVSGEPAAEGLPLAEGRLRLARQIRALAGDEPIGEVRRLTVAGADGPLPARLYVPTGDSGSTPDGPGPLCVYFHGGGFLFGDLDTHDHTCRFLAEQSGCRVLSVDYRLAPERQHPTQSLDCAAGVPLGGRARRGARGGRVPARRGRRLGRRLPGRGDGDHGGAGGPAVRLPGAALTRSRTPEAGTRSRELFGEGYFLTTRFHGPRPGGLVGARPRPSPTRRSRWSSCVILPAGLAPGVASPTAGLRPAARRGRGLRPRAGRRRGRGC